MTLTGRLENTDIPDPGTGDGEEQVMTLRCSTCWWNVTARAAIACDQARWHVAETDHEITYRGVVQACFRPSHLPKED